MTSSEQSFGTREALLARTLTDPEFRKVLRDDVPSALGTVGIELASTLGTSLRREIDEFFKRGYMPPGLDEGLPVSLEVAAGNATAGSGTSPRVAFVVMPWAESRWASIGVSLLKSSLTLASIDSDVIYPNLDFAESIGSAIYNRISTTSPKTTLVGEWLFSECSADCNRDDDERYLRDILLAEHSAFFDFSTIFRIGEVRTLTTPFLDALAQHRIWDRYDIVGFTSTFQQNTAVFGLARRLKELHPNLTIIMGGGNCEGPMGPAILRSFSAIDYVFQGEAESSIAQFVSDLRASSRYSHWIDEHPFWRSRANSLADGRAVIICDSPAAMDDLPIPDYRDYYHRFLKRRADSTLAPEAAIPIETSRGCWWGEKKHCTFCGLNGLTMAFRSKSAVRAFNELRELVHNYGSDPEHRTHVLVVDNILDYRYFRDFLPMMADSDLNVFLHYEVKANLRLDQLMLLRDAGVYHLQPGIESMSNRLLEAMRKGTTRLRNLQTLKWCTELGIDVSWNYLHGFPGESDDDYADLPDLFSLISHLPPPEHVGPARADRFSPFYESPDEFGIVELTHETAYDHLYASLPSADRSDLVS
jgi:ribosomal peptide maturation radical SAM protein 1